MSHNKSMKDLTTTTVRPTVANLRAGDVVRAGYVRGQRDMTDDNRFIGFKVGEQYFSKLQDLKEFFGVRNLRELEFEADRLQQFGSVIAEFQNVSDNDAYFRGAYLWEGSFRVGSSADKLTLKAA
jgi:hypothetical protein